MSKEQNQEKQDKTNEARPLSLSALGYQSSLERLLADISINFNTLQIRS